MFPQPLNSPWYLILTYKGSARGQRTHLVLFLIEKQSKVKYQY